MDFLHRRGRRVLAVALVAILTLIGTSAGDGAAPAAWPGARADDGAPGSPARAVAPAFPAAPAPRRQALLNLADADPWEQRAVWWHPDWRYRVPIDITSPADLQDGVVTIPVNWSALLATVGAGGQLDANSLRLIEYSPGGHIIPAYRPRAGGDLGANRFDRVPVELDAADPTAVRSLLPNQTPAGQTRRFFLYFDTVDHPHPALDYHYLSVRPVDRALEVARVGPDTETVARPLTVTVGLGGPVGLSTNGQTLQLGLPALDGTGACSGDLVADAAVQRSCSTAQADLSLAFPAQPARPGCAGLTGQGRVMVRPVLLPAGAAGAVVQATVTLAPASDIPLAPGQSLRLLQLTTASPASDVWTLDAGAGGRPLAAGQPDQLPPGRAAGVRSGQTALVRIDGLSAPAGLGGSSRAPVVSRADGRTLRLTLPGTLAAPDVWRAGEPLSLRVTALLGSSSLDDTALSGLLRGIDAAPAVQVGGAASFSQELLEAQLRYYETKGWDYVEQTLMTRGWGQPWNISYAYNLETGAFGPAHDNDSSMGAGFILYAAGLKAAMTGEARYYRIADAYANYFLQLEAEDVAEHGSGVAGRISYGYNGSDAPVNWGICISPPRQVPDCSSIDQMATSAMGLWQYANLDAGKIQFSDAVRGLLLRMGDYTLKGGPNVPSHPVLRNLARHLGAGTGDWAGAPSRFALPGVYYRAWLNQTTTDLNTGATANNFYVNGFFDRLLPRKDPALLQARYQSVVNDTGTATRGYYPFVRTVSYPPVWGYGDLEFPTVAMLKSVQNGLVAQPGRDPASYQLLAGGNRDATSGRMTQQAAVVAWAALEEPDGRMQVAGAPGPRYADYARDALHTTIAVLMEDSGGIRDGALGTLGNASAVRYQELTADFSGYYLLLMAQYRLLRGEVALPMPANGYDYIQGVAERDGQTTILYLGDQTIQQRLVFPNRQGPVAGGGVLPSPTLTYRPDGTAAEFADQGAGVALTLPVTLAYGAPQTGTVRQLPLTIQPDHGAVRVTVWSVDPATGVARLALLSDQGDRVAVQIAGLLPGGPVEPIAGGASAATADAAGTAQVAVAGGGETVVDVTVALPGVSLASARPRLTPTATAPAVAAGPTTPYRTPVPPARTPTAGTTGPGATPTATAPGLLTAGAGSGGDGLKLIAPLRVLDTRGAEVGGPIGFDGGGGPIRSGKLAAGQARRVKIAGQTFGSGAGAIPAGTTGLLLNVTIVTPAESVGGGFVTVYPGDAAQPDASTVNPSTPIAHNFWATGVPAAGPYAGTVNIYSTASLDVLLDVVGYFSPAEPRAGRADALAAAGNLQFITPVRVLDTRGRDVGGPIGYDAAGAQVPSGAIATGETRRYALAGRSFGSAERGNQITFPPNTSGIVAHVTLVSSAAAGGGFVTLLPGDAAGRPNASTVNPSTPIAFNTAAVAIPGTGSHAGTFQVYSTNALDVVVDVMGYYSPTNPSPGALTFVTPARVLDTRTGGTSLRAAASWPAAFAPVAGQLGATLRLPLAGRTYGALALPPEIKGVLANITVVAPTRDLVGGGYVTAFPAGASSVPNASTVNPSTPIAASFWANGLAASGPNAGIQAIYATAPLDVIVDVVGYYR